MQFDSFSDFLNMGGYAFYVWLAYGVSALLIILLIISSVFKHKAVKKHIFKRQKREDRLRQAAKQQKELAQATVTASDSNEVLS